MKNTLTPMINGFILVAVNIVFIFLFGPIFKVNGIALATTLSVNILALILFIEIKIRIKSISYKSVVIGFIKMMISGFVMSLGVNLTFTLLNNVLPTSNLYLLINIIISTIIGAVLYILMLLILKVQELGELLKLKRRNGEKHEK